MSRRLIYTAFWIEELQQLVDFLILHEYDPKEIEHLQSIINRKEESAS